MPASIVLECPHCGADKIGFALMCEAQSTIRQPGYGARYRALMVCPNCDEGIVAVFDNLNAMAKTQSPGQNSTANPLSLGWTLTKYYPQPAPSKCPSHVPDDLKRIFVQAADALKKVGPDASGAMSRKVVDVSTQQLLSDESKKYSNIQGRIDALAAAGKLTPELKDWAHQIRIDGNDAAHDQDPFTQEEAAELLDFAELYLTYIYTLPRRLKERRDRAAAEKAAKAAIPN